MARHFSRVVIGLAAACVGLWASAAAAGDITLVKDGATDYVIVVCKDASPSEQFAAKDLAAFLQQMSGAEMKIEAEGATVPEKAVLLGDGPAVRALGVGVDAAKLGDDGFVLKTVGQRLVIAGGHKRGTMYGAYAVLAKLGCRWWAPGESTVPQSKTITVPNLDETKVPVLEYRDMIYGDLWRGTAPSEDRPEGDAEWWEGRKWMARNHLHASFHEMPKELAPADMDTAIAHGVLRFIPLEKYKDTHPEFYALVRGKRAAGGQTQPCWSSEEGAKTAAENVIKMLGEHPNWKIITLGQEDWGVICECPDCKALVQKHGANSALVVTFINRVAAIVTQKYPNVWLNTNAYRWSQKAPKDLVCADSVMITIPPIACDYGRPLEEGWPQENADYKKDLEDWAKICKKIYVWDYTTNFVHYVMPWPNFYSIQPNIKFFVDHNVRGVFEQGSHTTPNGQFAPLCMWVEAQAMWDPQADGKALVKEFCLGYYGPKAGPLILDYINMLQDKVVKDKIAVWATHRTHLSAAYLTPEIIVKGEQLFRQAEAAVKDDPALLKRVRIAHFPIYYMLVRRDYVYMDSLKKVFPDLTYGAVAKAFVEAGRLGGIKRMAEGDAADPLFEWALDYAKAKDADPKAALPEELKNAAPGTFTYIAAPQFDQKVAFMQKVEGAALGWAIRIPGVGWSVTNELGANIDFRPGKTYKVYCRFMGKLKDPAKNTGGALSAGIHNPGRPRPEAVLKAAQMDGKWHVVEMSRPWAPDANGGAFFTCWHGDNKDNIAEGWIDAIWLVETASATAPAK